MVKWHCLTPYIEQLNEFSNTCNKWAICLACIEYKDHNYALLHKFTNTKKLCHNHLKNCKYFFKKYGQENAQKIIDDTDNEKITKKHWIEFESMYYTNVLL